MRAYELSLRTSTCPSSRGMLMLDFRNVSSGSGSCKGCGCASFSATFPALLLCCCKALLDSAAVASAATRCTSGAAAASANCLQHANWNASELHAKRPACCMLPRSSMLCNRPSMMGNLCARCDLA